METLDELRSYWEHSRAAAEYADEVEQFGLLLEDVSQEIKAYLEYLDAQSEGSSE
jgi:hypothetical protein